MMVMGSRGCQALSQRCDIRGKETQHQEMVVVREKEGASGPLCAHLLNHHAQEWVEACQEQKNIALRGKEREEALAKVSGVTVNCQAEAWAPFTQDNFLDSLVQFIVGTDQVFYSFPLFFFVLKFFFRG